MFMRLKNSVFTNFLNSYRTSTEFLHLHTAMELQNIEEEPVYSANNLSIVCRTMPRSTDLKCNSVYCVSQSNPRNKAANMPTNAFAHLYDLDVSWGTGFHLIIIIRRRRKDALE